ncbi:MAG: SDR family oxidoreductase [candidate division Zixibacteria bacterium]|nr:SDR family oxidoreductase [candidate division Zixibacteria bacterium]
MKFLVTGGAGFIGCNLVRRLLKDGHSVRVLDNFSSGSHENLADIISDIELMEGDIRDYWTVVRAVAGMECILHQAALPSVPRSVANPLTSNEVNINGTLNLLEAARYAGVRKFVSASSSSVYGETTELPKRESMVPSPLSPYAITKLTTEYYLKVYWQLYKLPTVSLRYFNIFGPYQSPKSEYAPVIPKFIACLLGNQPPIVFGDGEQSRDFTYIDNCVQANLLAAQSDQIVGESFNVACGGQYTLNDLLTQLRRIIGVETKARYEPARVGDIRHSFAAIDRLKSFGYQPTVDFSEGLRRTVEHFSRTSQGSKNR